MKSLVIPRIDLRTADPGRVEPFYRDVLGLAASRPAPGVLAFAFDAGAPPAIVFHEDRAARPPPRSAGLFHVALLATGRGQLGCALARLARHGWELQGCADHGVSEALYLADPDGNGLEIYADRPREAWPRDAAGRIAMFTAPLDLENLLAAAPAGAAAPPLAGGRIGHLHLQTVALGAAAEFYTQTAGLAVMQDTFPGARFLAADGYHHHLGLNTWARPARPAPPHATGLIGFTFAAADLAATRELADPDGNRVRLEPRAAA